MIANIALIVKILAMLAPLVYEIFKRIRVLGEREAALKEIDSDLQIATNRIVDRAVAARATVDHSVSGVQDDPYNRD